MIIEKNELEFYTESLRNLAPNSAFAIRGSAVYTNIEWLDKKDAVPTKEDVDAEFTRVKAVWVNTEYQRLRAAEYPSLTDQLDMQYHDSVNGTTTWQDAINAVKAKYPKSEGI